VLYELTRPLLFALDPETAHDIAFSGLRRAHAAGLTRLLSPRIADDPVELMGLRFPNPIGMAAGLDKNGTHIDAFASFGFGSIEVGTATPRPQPGNPRPRLFRLPQARALINRFGFNNVGIEQFVRNVEASHDAGRQGVVLGLNIGKNAATPIEQAFDDYAIGLRSVYRLLVERPGYVAINISSPNTKDLRALQGASELEELLGGLRDERHRLADAHGARVPMAVKIAPDLTSEDLLRVADTLVAFDVDAIIATNTTISRTEVAGQTHANETGGLSGAPLLARSTAIVRTLAQHLRGRLPIIAAGGVMSGADAVQKIEAGASIVQLYTGLIYHGLGLVAQCRRAVLAQRRGGVQLH
jgi:dihydroorotate dehydrogenase